ncbi:MAG: GNAT family N-acetyltransferase [Armatimonadetes bacterium]|nr:GNAT family N-acetyltransferase [Armatimonadota bacterium]
MAMTEVKIRTLQPEDVTTCARLYVAAYQAPPYDGCFDENLARAILTEMRQRSPETCFVAQVGETVVGFILCSTLAGVRATIEEFAVDPAYQGLGIGRRLLEHVCNLFRQSHYATVELIVDRLAPVHSMYRRFGFTESDRYRLMSLEL